MPRYALVNPSDAIDRLSYTVTPTVATKSGWRWLQCDPVSAPDYDPSTERITGPAYTVGASSVTEVWTKVSLSAQEISDAKDGAVNAINDTAFSVLAKVLLNHENRIRALEGKASVTMTQFKNGVKALL